MASTLWRSNNAWSSDTTFSLYVNGTKSVLSFPSTGGFNGEGHWAEVTTTITLNPGTNNTLIVERDNDVGAVNLDKFTVSP